jgi:hypothetical protein
VKGIAVVANDAKQLVPDTIAERCSGNVVEFVVPPLTDAQVDDVVATFAELSTLATNARSRNCFAVLWSWICSCEAASRLRPSAMPTRCFGYGAGWFGATAIGSRQFRSRGGGRRGCDAPARGWSAKAGRPRGAPAR